MAVVDTDDILLNKYLCSFSVHRYYTKTYILLNLPSKKIVGA